MSEVPGKRKGRGAGLGELAWIGGGWIAFWCVITVLSHTSLAHPPANAHEENASVLTAYVSDFAGSLSPGVPEKLTAALAEFEKETSNQVAVAIYPRLPGTSVEEFTMAVADSSRLGRKGLDNGAILAVFAQERIARLEVGYGLEGALTDLAAHRILETDLAPAWSGGDADRAVMQTVEAITRTVREEYRGGRMPGRLEVFRRQVMVELPKFFQSLLPALMEQGVQARIVITIIGTLLTLGLWDGVVQTVALARNAIALARNVRAGRAAGRATKSVRLESIGDSMTVVLLFGFVLAGLAGAVIVAAGGAFGGAGATVHW